MDLAGPANEGSAVTVDPVLQSILARLDVSDRMVRAEYELLPLLGDGQPTVRPQIRAYSSQALTPEGLDQLVQSIAAVGQLQPIIVERMPGEGDVLIAGQRRLQAMQLGAQQYPDNPHLAKGIRALVVEGPLGVYERRAVQLAENLARKDLSQVDKGRALWLSRVSLLRDRIVDAGADIPDWEELLADRIRDVPDALDDPSERFKAVQAWKQKHAPDLAQVGARWDEAARALGMDIAEETARDIARVFRDLGEQRMEVLDELGATTRTMRAARELTNRGLGDAVDEINARVAELTETEPGVDSNRVVEDAFRAVKEDPEVPAATAVEHALPSTDDSSSSARPVVAPASVTVDTEVVGAVDLLTEELRELNRFLDESVRPAVDAASTHVADGVQVAAAAEETVLMLCDSVDDVLHDVRSLFGSSG